MHEVQKNRKATFHKLYRSLRPFYQADEMELINQIGSAADGDFDSPEGLEKQITWMRAELNGLLNMLDDD